jgi:hypothetical protein
MRHIDWQIRLSEYLTKVRSEPFVFETHNCLFHVFNGIKAVNDLDLMPLYEGRATSEKAGALALRHVDGVDSVEAVLLKHLGGEFQPTAFARPGDIVFIEDYNSEYEIYSDTLFGPVPGICYGMTSFFLGENGVIEIPTSLTDKTLWVS